MKLQTLSVFLLLSLYQGSVLATLIYEAATAEVLAKAKPGIVPVTDKASPVEVDVSISLMHINGVDLEAEAVDLVIVQSINWKDESLVWDPKEPKTNVEFVIVPVEKIWYPDITCDSCVSNSELLSPELATVYYDGSIYFEPKERLRVSCPGIREVDSTTGVDCSIDLESWVHTVKVLTLADPSPYSFELSEFESTIYTISDVSVGKSRLDYSGDQVMDSLKFTFRLHRQKEESS